MGAAWLLVLRCNCWHASRMLPPTCSNPPDTPHEPDVIPTATALPHWNSMAFFKVQPGFSFHSIQVGWGGAVWRGGMWRVLA